MALDYSLIHGDCLEEMSRIEAGSIDAIFSDPPYPYIKRDYGYWTEAEWMPMMQEVVRQSRRVLKPHGSAVFVLQPNSEKVGKMRLWLWKFMVWAGDEWGIVQDAYWWNYTAIPGDNKGLMRPSVKPCIWLGNDNCFRDEKRVLWDISDRSLENSKRGNNLHYGNGGHSVRHARTTKRMMQLNGTSPYNMVFIPNNGNDNAHGHSSGTPLKLSDWWLRYIAKPGGVVLDPFSGTGTTGVAARRLGLDYIGIERTEKYHLVAEHRLATALDDKPRPAKKPVEDLPMFAGVIEWH